MKGTEKAAEHLKVCYHSISQTVMVYEVSLE